MPYTTISQLPEHVHKYSEVVQRQWMHVWMTVYEKVLKESKSAKDAEKRAFMAANAILRKRFTKENYSSSDNQHDYFSFLIDNFLKNV